MSEVELVEKLAHALSERSGEQSKPEAPLGNTLPVIVTLFFYEGSPSIWHVTHFQFAGTVTTRNRHAIVGGDRMRMFSAQECRAAMGFPAYYELPAQHQLAVHMLRNAVCPPATRDITLALTEAA
jgi:hypothetical protein